MRNFQDTFETCKRSFISAFPVCMGCTLKSTPNYSSQGHTGMTSEAHNLVFLVCNQMWRFLNSL